MPRVTLTQKIALVTIASESTQLEFWEITKCQGMSAYRYANYLVEYLEQKHITINLTLLERDPLQGKSKSAGEETRKLETLHLQN